MKNAIKKERTKDFETGKKGNPVWQVNTNQRDCTATSFLFTATPKLEDGRGEKGKWKRNKKKTKGRMYSRNVGRWVVVHHYPIFLSLARFSRKQNKQKPNNQNSKRLVGQVDIDAEPRQAPKLRNQGRAVQRHSIHRLVQSRR